MGSWTSDLGLQKSTAETRLALLPQYSLSFAMETNKPYFGRHLSAFQSCPVRYALMAALTRYALGGKKQGARVLEIGSWAGASAITFGMVIRELGISDSQIVCVDPWEQYFEEGDRSIHHRSMNAAAASGEILNLFRHNVRACGLEKMIYVKKAYSQEALPELESDSFDLIYIDGSHKKEDVLYDLEQAKRLVRSGGIICGDDLEISKSNVDPIAHEAALKNNVDFVADPRSGVNYHPGVTEAVSATFDDVWLESGFWFVERSGVQWNVPVFHIPRPEIPNHLTHAVEIPYGIFCGYELFQLGDGFVAYPIEDANWFQNRILTSSLDELVFLLDSIENKNRDRPPRIIEFKHGFNILTYRGKAWALDASVGEVNFLDEVQIGRLVASGQLIGATTVDEARSVVDMRFVEFRVASLERGQESLAHRISIIAPESNARACLLEEDYHGFNLVAYAGKIWAVKMAAGPLDFTDAEAVEDWLSDGRLLHAATPEGARAAVDRDAESGISN